MWPLSSLKSWATKQTFSSEQNIILSFFWLGPFITFLGPLIFWTFFQRQLSHWGLHRDISTFSLVIQAKLPFFISCYMFSDFSMLHFSLSSVELTWQQWTSILFWFLHSRKQHIKISLTESKLKVTFTFPLQILCTFFDKMTFWGCAIPACKTSGSMLIIGLLKGGTISFFGVRSSLIYWLFHSLHGAYFSVVEFHNAIRCSSVLCPFRGVTVPVA